jgi:transcriptional regulator with XRE-family HTH domain
MARPSGKALNPDAYRDVVERLDRPLTDAQVAEEARISPSTLSGLLSGVTRASNETATALSLVLRCRRGTLFPEFVNFGARPKPVRDQAVAS